MRSPLRMGTGTWAVRALVVAAMALVGQACQDQPDPLDPSLAKTKVSRTLTVTGGGTGAGRVTAPDYGEAGALNCQITEGSQDPIECTKLYGWKTAVELTATPENGNTFNGWSGACTGTGRTCRVVMTQSRSVRASFTGPGVPSYNVNVAGAGTGDGTVRTQNISPAIDCTINAGSASGGTCTGRYPSGTVVTLTMSPASGNVFDGWSGACTGTGNCTFTVSDNAVVTATLTAPAGVEATVGRWDAPRRDNVTVIGLHLSLLKNGNALLWGHGGQPQVLNPFTGVFTTATNETCVNPQTCELFCAGHTFLADGRLFVAGGHNEALGDNNGIRESSTFDGTGWQSAGPMKYARWYPTLVTLDNGQVVALSGNQAPTVNATVPERWNGSAWEELTGASLQIPLYPKAFVEPKNGFVFVAGEGPSRYLNPFGTGAWTLGPTRVVSSRSYGSAVMLDSKVLYAGGGGSGCPTLPERSSEIIDLGATTPAWRRTADSLEFRRRQTNMTILADGKVLMTGGTGQCGFTTESGAVFASEIFDPATEQWTTVDNASEVRVYHSTTLLLPDGRVLSTGSGDGGGVTQQYSYEIFSPPYLFWGPRPTYTAPTDLGYNQSFTISTAEAASIQKVLLIRHASTTHSHDMGQRLNTLQFTRASGSLSVTSPASGKVAPPGPYMLFIVNDRGVPSVAQTVILR